MREGARAAILVASVCILFAAMAGFGTRAAPYAPNDWAFSHVILAQRALDTGHMPLNARVVVENGFAQTAGEFQRDTGLSRLTFYASTVWHFWNGLPLQPTLLATLACVAGLSPEDASRLPIAGAVVVLLVAASAGLLVRRSAAWIAPFLVAAGCAPFLLDMRVLMPSTTLVLVGLLMHALVRRALLADRAVFVWGLAPLLLLPFWYYTVAYFVILLLLAFALAHVVLKRERAALIPVWACLLVPMLLTGALLLNGALTSHLELAKQTTWTRWLMPDGGSDYTSHLNREPWRSAVLYAQVLALFGPLAWLGLRVASRRFKRASLEAPQAVFACWALGGLLFSVLLEGAVGVSFLNRTVIYLAPAGAVVAAWWLGKRWSDPRVRKGAVVALALMGVASVGLVGTAMPQYTPGDVAAYKWMSSHVDRGDVVYSSLEASSVLLRSHGFDNVIAFYPREDLLERFWYANGTETIVPYLPNFDDFVLRKAVETQGFEEFGPARLPISKEAYEKFSVSHDLHLVYDDGDVRVYRVALEPERFQALPNGSVWSPDALSPGGGEP